MVNENINVDERLTRFEDDMLKYLTQNPTREQVKDFVKRNYTNDQSLNEKIFKRAQFVLLLESVCREYLARQN